MLIAGVVAAMVGAKRFAAKSKKKNAPPENTVVSVVVEDLQESFEDSIDRIQSDLDGNDPAGDLADLGNARRRK